jgi:adenosylhomocysteine nucleosidase
MSAPRRLGTTTMLLAVLLQVQAALAQPAPEARRPILVQGAMAVETDRLAARLENVIVDRVGSWTFWRGTIDGYPVIVSKTLKGTANAAAATAIAVERYRPVAIINQGTAGGHDPGLRLYDIVLGTSSVNLGAFRSPYRAAGAGSNPLEWIPLNLTLADGSAANDPNARQLAAFAADAELLQAARRARSSYHKGRVVEGVIGTSDGWNDEIDLINRFHSRYGTLVEEMETASSAQIARLFDVPFLGIRIVSDNVTNGTAWDPKTAEACEDFVYEVVRVYVAVAPR